MDVDPNHTTNKRNEDDDGELSMETDEFPFPTSQSVDDTFREATLVARYFSRKLLINTFQRISKKVCGT